MIIGVLIGVMTVSIWRLKRSIRNKYLYLGDR